MKKHVISLALATASLLAAGSSVATGESSHAKDGLSFNPGVGYFSFDSALNLDNEAYPSIGMEYRFANNIAIEGTYVSTETNQVNNPESNYDWSHIHLDTLYYFNPGKKLQPYLALGAGEGTFSYSTGRNDDSETLINIGGGVKYFFTQGLSLRADLRGVNSTDNERTASAATISLSWLIGGSSTSDKQGDFEIAKESNKEVQPIALAPDADVDTVADTLDRCPGTPPAVAVDEKGCALDVDNDGIADYRDRCAGTTVGTQVDSLGCPQDLDQDGIADFEDKCLGSKKGHLIDEFGCAIQLTESVSMNLNVNFPINSAVLPKELVNEVEELATFMKRYANTIAVIEGHSDNLGDASYNRFLSQKRAETIRKILISQFNISENRLRAIGYGEDKPVADNQTSEGRQQNRRVVAVINSPVESN